MQLISAFIVASLLLLQSAQVQGEENIVETIIADGKFTTLLAALNYTALLPVLESNTTYTVFGPNDDAFKKLPNGVLDELLQPENNQSLSKILEYHVVSSNLTKEDILNMTLPANITMLDGGFATLSKNETELKINTATIIKADTFASNGVIHTIDELILPPLDIVETAITKGTFFTLIKALKAADLFATLKGTGPFTVFAPNDEAFAKLSNETLDDLFKPENKGKLINILQYHVISKRVTAADIKSMKLPAQIETLSKLSPIIDLFGESVKVNNATVITADVFSVNGVIHVVDTVLFPPSDIPETAITNGNFKTLVAALNITQLITTLEGTGPFTVFGPNDDAFKKLPNGVLEELTQPENKQSLSKILQYHVTNALYTSASIGRMTLPTNVTMLAGGVAVLSKNGAELKIGNAAIIKADTFTLNGMIHVIDGVMLPPLDIVETAITKGTFFTLIKALKAADLFATLKGTGPFTVFAPNDEAFAKLSNETLDDLFKPENKEKLARTLKYHVVNGKLSSSDLTQGRNLDMLDGGSVSISNDGGKIKINDANVILSDVDTVNGYVHVIDSVLFPSSKSGMSLYSAQGLIISLVMTILCVYRSVV